MKNSLFVRILTAVCRKLWAVLLFFSLFATAHLLDFAWPALASSSQQLAVWMKGLLR